MTENRKERDDLFRLLVESVRDYAIFLLSPTGHIMTWNEGARRLKGYADADIIGKHFSIFYPPSEIKRGKPEYELRVAIDDGRYEEEGWRLRKDGSRFWANVVITALFDSRGEHVGFAKVTRDLTERRQAEDDRKALLDLERRSRTETEATLERLRAVQLVTEAALAHLRLDDLLQELLDRVTESLVVDTAAILLMSDDGQRLVARAAKGVEEEVDRGVQIPVGQGFAGRIASERQPIAIDDVEHSDVINPILRARGIRSLLGVPLFVETQVIGVLHVGSLHFRHFGEFDIQFLQIVADRVAMAIEHARLIESERHAREVADVVQATLRAQDEFLTVAAHELKTPLTSLRLSAQLLQRNIQAGTPLDRVNVQRILTTIDHQVGRLARLVGQILDTIRLQSDGVPLEREGVDLTELTKRVARTMQARSPGHELRVVAPGPLQVFVDVQRIDQLLANLLDNAMKFSPDGGPVVVTLSRPATEHVQLSVRDWGLGVVPEHRPHLFERFYQAHNDSHRSGIGLGLYLCRQVVQQHGGDIWAEFPADGGTEIIAVIPASLSDDTSSVEEARAR
ncbi:MAG: GAF domain-containing protein [Chloroflexi bacterium]|nr:GAF domain-containing protein [Chloroflexota bacterium]